VTVVLVLWIVLGWAVLACLTAVVFAAVGRNALREDEAMGQDEPIVPVDDRETALSS
jgi:hypothetical protein